MLTSTTAPLKPADVEKKWIVIDAEDAVLGRLASFIAMRLRGKHLPNYTSHTDGGDNVIVINAEKVHLTGKKHNEIFYWHTGHPGGVKQRTLGQLLNGKYPERVLTKAVERMMPKESPLARKQMTQLRIFAGATHTHEAQQPEVIDFKSLSRKNVRSA
ncbi:50S ribosomal protein L13 [Asticcacaulis sp. EMRT-3]|uniref:50S ribosomal protein L13 n=1 Tax=Asticcacaulis sp. EMRT-3 TaxID=3040349 RepID=UPI0024AEE301|nr:50S ribosomal protein L13 [Asticcacaulis sp. EMRT-3]MDI7774857.1 50S ribosomal protein L13 [Asticcacaulis sp. EMRT-3]